MFSRFVKWVQSTEAMLSFGERLLPIGGAYAMSFLAWLYSFRNVFWICFVSLIVFTLLSFLLLIYESRGNRKKASVSGKRKRIEAEPLNKKKATFSLSVILSMVIAPVWVAFGYLAKEKEDSPIKANVRWVHFKPNEPYVFQVAVTNTGVPVQVGVGSVFATLPSGSRYAVHPLNIEGPRTLDLEGGPLVIRQKDMAQTVLADPIETNDLEEFFLFATIPGIKPNLAETLFETGRFDFTFVDVLGRKTTAWIKVVDERRPDVLEVRPPD